MLCSIIMYHFKGYLQKIKYLLLFFYFLLLLLLLYITHTHFKPTKILSPDWLLYTHTPCCIIASFSSRFNSSVRDLLSWATEIEREMNAEKAVRDVNSVDMLRARHEELRAEIETRQDTFETVIRTGEDMVQKEHYAKDEVLE